MKKFLFLASTIAIATLSAEDYNNSSYTQNQQPSYQQNAGMQGQNSDYSQQVQPQYQQQSQPEYQQQGQAQYQQQGQAQPQQQGQPQYDLQNTRNTAPAGSSYGNARQDTRFRINNSKSNSNPQGAFGSYNQRTYRKPKPQPQVDNSVAYTNAYQNNPIDQLWYQNNSKDPHAPNVPQSWDQNSQNSGWYQDANGNYFQAPNGSYPDGQYNQPQQYYQQGSYDQGYSNNGSYNETTGVYTTGVYSSQPEGYSTSPGFHDSYGSYDNGSAFNAQGGTNKPFQDGASRYNAGLGR